MKKLFQTLLVTLLVVSLLASPVTAFAAGDSVDGENTQGATVTADEQKDEQAPTESEALPEEKEQAPGENETLPEEKEQAPGENEILPEEKEQAPGKTEENSSEPEAQIQSVGEGEPLESNSKPSDSETRASEGIHASFEIRMYADGTLVRSGKIMEGSSLLVEIMVNNIWYDMPGDMLDSISGSYAASAGLELQDSDAFDLNTTDGGGSYTQTVSYNLTAKAGQKITFSVKDLKAVYQGTPVVFEYITPASVTLEVVSAGASADEKESLYDEAQKLFDSTSPKWESYTDPSWDNFRHAYDDVMSLIDDAASSSADLKAAMDAMNQASNALKVWKQSGPLYEAQKALLEAGTKVAESNLPSEVKDLLSRTGYTYLSGLKINEGETYDGNSYSQWVTIVNGNLATVNKILAGELPAKKDKLQSLYDEILNETLDSSRYTKDSYKAYTEEREMALDNALAALEEPLAEQEWVDDAVYWLESLRSTLVKILDDERIEELERALADAEVTAGSAGLTGDQLMAYERANTMLSNLIEAYKAKLPTFTDGLPNTDPFPVMDFVADTLERALALAAEGKMPADRSDLEDAVAAAKKALEQKKAFASDEFYKELQAQVASAETVIDYKNNPSSTLRLPEDIRGQADYLRYLTEEVLALKEDSDLDDVPKTGDPMVQVFLGGAVLLTLLGAACLGKKVLVRK